LEWQNWRGGNVKTEIVDVVKEVNKRYGCAYKQIFRDAFRYANRNTDRLEEHFANWQNHGILHEDVEEYCLYVLSERIKL
jgi:hypothetical protein